MRVSKKRQCLVRLHPDVCGRCNFQSIIELGPPYKGSSRCHPDGFTEGNSKTWKHTGAGVWFLHNCFRWWSEQFNKASHLFLWSGCRYVPGTVAAGDETRLWCKGQRPLRDGFALSSQQDCSRIHDIPTEHRSWWWQHCRGRGWSFRGEGSEGRWLERRLCTEGTQRRAPCETEVPCREGLQH
jgi:hypothetical protein